MKIVRIPKGRDKFRTIYVPTEAEKTLSYNWIDSLTAEVLKHPLCDVLHGFMPGRSPVTNALVHVNYLFTLSFDLADWFDSIRRDRVYFCKSGGPFAFPSFARECFFDGAPRQGLPSSPMIANLAALPMIEDVAKLQTKGRFTNFVFSVYADDWTFSTNSMDVVKMLKKEFPKIVRSHHYKINPDKTHLQCAKAGRRIICGVAVDGKAVYPTRDVRRRLRAALHQQANGLRYRGRRKLIGLLMEIKRQGKKSSLPLLNRMQVNGLSEWVKLKLPKAFRSAGRALVEQHVGTVTANAVEHGSFIRRFQ